MEKVSTYIKDHEVPKFERMKLEDAALLANAIMVYQKFGFLEAGWTNEDKNFYWRKLRQAAAKFLKEHGFEA